MTDPAGSNVAPTASEPTADTANSDVNASSDPEDTGGAAPKAGRAEGGTKDFPSTSPDTPHAQRDGYVWNDETGWTPPA